LEKNFRLNNISFNSRRL